MGEPIVSITVQNMKGSNCAGAFSGASINVNAQYEDYVGSYCAAMPMSTDTAILFGRETMGEPKKQADARIETNGDRIVATVSRKGVEGIRIAVKLGDKLDTNLLSKAGVFHHKFTFAPDGSGLDDDPKVVYSEFTYYNGEQLNACSVEELKLNASEFDVFGEIPVVEIVSAIYTPGYDINGASKYIGTVSKEEYLPYAFFKVDPYEIYHR